MPTLRPVDVVAAEWCAVLETETARDDDEFFRLGGDSLKVLQLIDGIQSRLGIEFPLDVLFLDGTFAAIARACAESVAAR